MTEPVELATADDEQEEFLPTQIFAPKWYLNGFPKAGTHLLVSMMKAHARPMPPVQMHPKEWIGTFDHHSWTNEWCDMTRLMYDFGHLLPGYYFKGHCGWTEELETHLLNLGIAMVFIYRDLRDVAVSQTFHILTEDKSGWRHDNKEAYRELGFDGALEAVIVGKQIGDVWYPGVIERWEHYAPWLDVGWVESISFQEARLDPEQVAARLIRYGLGRLARIYGMELMEPGEAFQDAVNEMAESSRDTDNSNTFRKGQVGGWREHLTEGHKRLFKDGDNGWLVRLGFEKNNDW